MSLIGGDHESDAKNGGNGMIIRDGPTGKRREIKNHEGGDIAAHLKAYPECDGSMIVDNHDQTTWTARPYLHCDGCDVDVDPA
jgi:hypothetical protein